MDTQEYEISLPDLVKTIARRWRFVIICLIITTIATSGFCIIKNYLANRTNQAQNNDIKDIYVENDDGIEEINVDAIEEFTTLNSSQISDARVAADMYSVLKENYEYFQEESTHNSKYNEQIVLQYMIKSKATDNGSSLDLTNNIGKALEQYIVSGGMAKTIASQCDEKVSLFDLKNSIRIDFTEIVSAVETDSATAIYRTAPVTIVCRGKDVIQAMSIVEYVKKEVGIFCEKFSQYGECSIEFIEMYEGNEKDLESMNQGISDISKTYNAKNQFNAFVKEFNDEQKALVNAIVGAQVLASEVKLGSTSDTSEPDTISLTSGLKKFVRVGVFAGLFVSCVWIAMVYILNGTIKTKDDIAGVFGYYCLGNLKRAREYKGIGAEIDKIIDKKNEENLIPIEDRMDILISNIKAICKKEEIKDVIISSTTIMSDENRKYIDDIISLLGNNDISSSFENNVLTNVAGFDKMTEKKNLIVVEKLGDSKIRDIEKLSGICKKHGVNVLGFVCI